MLHVSSLLIYVSVNFTLYLYQKKKIHMFHIFDTYFILLKVLFISTLLIAQLYIVILLNLLLVLMIEKS